MRSDKTSPATPPPVRRLIGNLSNTIGLFVGLDLDTTSQTALRQFPDARRAVRRAKVGSSSK